MAASMAAWSPSTQPQKSFTAASSLAKPLACQLSRTDWGVVWSPQLATMKQMVTRVPFLLFTSRLSAHFSGERPYQLPHIETKSTLSGRPIRQLTGDAP